MSEIPTKKTAEAKAYGSACAWEMDLRVPRPELREEFTVLV